MRYHLLLLFILLNACSGALLAPPAQQLALPRLIAANTKRLNVSLLGLEGMGSAGWQFILGIIPLGRIKIDQLELHLCNGALEELAIAGFNSSCEDTTDTLLQIRLEDLSVNGYDYLFFRRPLATVTLRADLISKSGAVISQATAQGIGKEITKFAFEAELEAVLKEAIADAMRQLIKQLRLS